MAAAAITAAGQHPMGLSWKRRNQVGCPGGLGMGEESHPSVRKHAHSLWTDDSKKSNNFTERKFLFTRSHCDQSLTMSPSYVFMTLETMNANLIKIRMKLPLIVGIRKSTSMRGGGTLGNKH